MTRFWYTFLEPVSPLLPDTSQVNCNINFVLPAVVQLQVFKFSPAGNTAVSVTYCSIWSKVEVSSFVYFCFCCSLCNVYIRMVLRIHWGWITVASFHSITRGQWLVTYCTKYRQQWLSSPPYWATRSLVHCSKTTTWSIRPRCQTHTPYQPIRSLESVARRETASGHGRDGDVPVVGHPPLGFTRSAVTHTGVTATEALQLTEDRPFWRTITTRAGKNLGFWKKFLGF